METDDDPPRRCLSGAICTTTGICETQIESNAVTADAIALVKRCIQKRYDGERKPKAFMTIEAIAHCEPSNNDWLVGFNDYSRHDEVSHVLDDAIAQSEPCQECEAPLTRETFHLLTIEGTDKVLCENCSMFYG